MKKIIFILLTSLIVLSCSLDRNPYDALSTSTFPKTEEDLEMMAIGCYDGYVDQNYTVYNDVMTDNGYCAINRNYSTYASGTATHANPGIGWFNYQLITRCNNFLNQVDNPNIVINNPKRLLQRKNEIRFLRAWRYYMMVTAYGDIPLVTSIVNSLDESLIPATSENEVVSFILKELNDITKDGELDVKAEQNGRITRGAALALKMRLCLYYKKYDEAINAADEIINLQVYDLYKDGDIPYSEVFKEANEDNSEIILANKRIIDQYRNGTIIEFCNVSDGGWSAFVPIQNLVDEYEMNNGLTIEEAQLTGEYDPIHPYKNRDPRFYATILYSGADWVNPKGIPRIYNTLDKEINEVTNKDHKSYSTDASQTGYTVCKYMNPLTQYADINNTGLDLIVFRYAEVLLSKAEALIELNKNVSDLKMAISLINEIRSRAGMPNINETKYNDQIRLREIVRRERRVEFAFEGLRRDDIVRWEIAHDVLNGAIYGANNGTVIMDTNISPEERALIEIGEENRESIEIRSFKNTYMPIPQSELDKNPNLKQTNLTN